jgi:hypothetical protein
VEINESCRYSIGRRLKERGFDAGKGAKGKRMRLGLKLAIDAYDSATAL